MSKPEDEWLDYRNAAKYLHDKLPGGFTVRALQRAKWDGMVPAMKNRGKVFFSKADLDQYAKEVMTPR